MFWWLVCVCALLAHLSASDGPVVVTSGGPVRGRLLHDHGVFYYAYQGIPYAENPTGPLRFKPPVPKEPWSEMLDAGEPGPPCPQPTGKYTRHDMSEDCLRINVFVPANTSQQILPVLAFVHGGGFKANSGNMDDILGPQLLLKRDIIYVSMNFRLGALGFLSFGTKEAPGNAGLHDLLLALEWIKENVHRFGGGTVTLGGQSSGSAMIHYMLLSDKSSGLFDRAILSSGSATNFRFLSRYPREHAYALAKELKLPTDSDDIIVQNLRIANVFDIIDAQENLYKNDRNIMSMFGPFVPCIEKEFEHSILTRDPNEIIESGIPQNVPILAGINSLEGAYLWPTLHDKSSTFLQERFPWAIPANIEYPIDSDMYKDLVASVSELYFGDTKLSNWTSNNLYELLSDTQFTYVVGSWIEQYKSRKSSEKLYYYMFNYDGDFNWSKIKYKINYPGVVHADELGYLFVNQVTEDRLNNTEGTSQQTMDNMLTFITNFVKYGNPTPKVDADGVEWPEYGGAGRHLIINDRPEPSPLAPFAKRFAFWTNVYRQYRQYIQDGGARQTRMPPP